MDTSHENEKHQVQLISRIKIIEYRIDQYSELSNEIKLLKNKVHDLEMHKATQIGQDKIVGFVSGAIILSIVSILVPFFIRFDDPSYTQKNSVNTRHDSGFCSKIISNNRID